VRNVKKRLGKAGLRLVRRHPRGAWRVSVFVFRHWRFVADLYVAKRRLSRLRHRSTAATHKAASKATVHDLVEVADRIRSLGALRGLTDSRVAEALSGVSRHAAKVAAPAHSTRDRHRHRGRTVAAAGVGAALLGATAYRHRSPSV
jgi:hypothetical protein